MRHAHVLPLFVYSDISYMQSAEREYRSKYIKVVNHALCCHHASL